MIPARYVIFTDLDHTVLGAGGNTKGVPQVVSILELLGIPVIPVTAKSIYEIVATLPILGIGKYMPFISIAESGAAVYAEEGILPWTDDSIQIDGLNLEYVILGENVNLEQIDKVANTIFKSVNCDPPPIDVANMTVNELSQISRLPPSLAKLIPRRHFMKIYYHPDTNCKKKAAEKLKIKGYYVGVGRNFIHIGKHRGKGYATRWAVENIPRIARAYTIVFGDSDHDREMLEQAFIAVVIPPLNGPPLRLRRGDYIIAPHPAPDGWVTISKYFILNPP